MLAQSQSPSPSIAISRPRLIVQTAPDAYAKLSLNGIAAALQVVLAIRRAARIEEHTSWSTVARGM